MSSWKFSMVNPKLFRTKSFGKNTGSQSWTWLISICLGRFCATSKSTPIGKENWLSRLSCAKLITLVHYSGILGLPRPYELWLWKLTSSSSCSYGTSFPISEMLSSEWSLSMVSSKIISIRLLENLIPIMHRHTYLKEHLLEPAARGR